MKRVPLILGMAFLLCWLILVVFYSALNPVFSESPYMDSSISIVSALTIATTLLLLVLTRKRCGHLVARYGVSFSSGLFIIANASLILELLSPEALPWRTYLIVIVASIAAAMLLLVFLKAYTGCSEKELAVIYPSTLLIAAGCSIVAGMLQQQMQGVLLVSSLIASVCLLLNWKNPVKQARDDYQYDGKDNLSNAASGVRSESLSDHQSDSHRINTRGIVIFFLATSVVILSFFSVYGYNKTVALFVGVSAPEPYIFAFIICTLTTVILVGVQRKLERPLLFCPLLGFATAVQGILMMAVEPIGVSLVPAASAISLSILILVIGGVVSLSVRLTRIKAFDQMVPLTVLLIPLFLGVALGTALAREYVGSFEGYPFVRIVLLCTLFCPYAFLISGVHEKEDHFFYDTPTSNGSFDGSYSSSGFVGDLGSGGFPSPEPSGEIGSTGKQAEPRTIAGEAKTTQPKETSTCLSHNPANVLSEDFSLTFREKEILDYLLRGRDVVYISNDLFISKNTVATHIKHIYHKLNIHSKQELITLAEKRMTECEVRSGDSSDSR